MTYNRCNLNALMKIINKNVSVYNNYIQMPFLMHVSNNKNNNNNNNNNNSNNSNNIKNRWVPTFNFYFQI